VLVSWRIGGSADVEGFGVSLLGRVGVGLLFGCFLEGFVE